MKIAKSVKNKYGLPDQSKSGDYIFTNGIGFFTLSLESFRSMRAAMAEIERLAEHANDRKKFEEENYERSTAKEGV